MMREMASVAQESRDNGWNAQEFLCPAPWRNMDQGVARSGFSSLDKARRDRAMRYGIAHGRWCVAAGPIRIVGANRAGRPMVRIEAKNGQRRSAPHCAGDELSGPLAPAAQPGHGRTCQGSRIITRTVR